MDRRTRPQESNAGRRWLTVAGAAGVSAALVNAGLLSPWLARTAWAGALLVLGATELAGWLARAATRGRSVHPSLAAGASVGAPSAVGPPGAAEHAGRTTAWAKRPALPAGVAVAALGLALWGAATGFLLPGRQVIPVLTYHRVAHPPRRHYPVPVTSPEDFARQMAWLDSRGYRTISPDRLLAPGREPSPAKPVIITFDDGWRDNLLASRLMRRHSYTGVIFVVTGDLGRPLALRAADLRALERGGFLIGSHTVTHPHLDRLSEPARWRELRESRQTLERLLGHPVGLFASPYGSADLAPDLEKLIQRAGYRLAFASHNFGLNTARPPRWAVRRLLVPSNPTLARLEFLLLLW